jgi:phage shock protein A
VTINNYGNLEKDKKALEDRCGNQIKQNEELKYIVSKLENDISGYRKNENQLKDL